MLESQAHEETRTLFVFLRGELRQDLAPRLSTQLNSLREYTAIIQYAANEGFYSDFYNRIL